MAKENIKAITEENSKDFISLYRIFEEPPYEEFFTQEELENEYKKLSGLGYVLGYYLDGKCVGMIAFYGSANENGIVDPEHPVHYDHPEKVAYLSDITVLKEYRCRGIGRELMEHALEVCKADGFEKIYLRTLQKGQSMSYGLAVRLGFQVLENVEQSVVQERVNEQRNKQDMRIFLEKVIK